MEYLKVKLEPVPALRPARPKADTENPAEVPEVEDQLDSFQVGEMIGSLYRPNFETTLYPYPPTHIKKMKEIKKLYLVHLPENSI